MNYVEIAKKQFSDLKKESLRDDAECVGASNEMEYDHNGAKIKIWVEGFWESSVWFTWSAQNDGKVVERGHVDF